MQKYKFRNCLQMLSVLLFMAFVSVSCIKDDFSHCPKPGYSLQVKAFDADNHELDKETVKDVMLYVFDENKAFLESRSIALREPVAISYPGHESFMLVAWGNSKQGQQTMPALKPGDLLETAFVSLPHVKSSPVVAALPGDLFYGAVYLQPNKATVNELSVRRKTSSVVITARYLKEYAGSTEGEFRYVLSKSTDKMDFYGKPNGLEVEHTPEAAFDTQGDFVSSIFNIFPVGSPLKIDIYYRDTLIASITSDNEGKPIHVVEGRLLNVFVNFRGNVSVGVKVTDWGEKEIWKEF